MGATKDAVFIGTDAGEFAGRLFRIDLRHRDRSTVLEGTPVLAVETEPWNPQCVIAAIGNNALTQRGSLVEICPKRTVTLFSAPPDTTLSLRGKIGDGTQPFVALGRSGRTIWAASGAAIYRVENGSVTKQPELKFHRGPWLDLSLDIPGVAVLRFLSGPFDRRNRPSFFPR